MNVRGALILALTLFFVCKNVHSEESKKAPPFKQPAQHNALTSAPNAKTVKPQSALAKNIEPTAEQRGEKIFKKHYCVGCHADGNNALMPDKPIKGEAFAQKYCSDATLENTIRKGFPDEGMPSFPASQISENQMKDLILYIRSFTRKK